MTSKTNYFIGQDPKGWHKDIANYSKVNYENLYAGIDMVFYGNQNKLEYDMRVSPNADPRVIQFKVEGAKGLSLNNYW